VKRERERERERGLWVIFLAVFWQFFQFLAVFGSSKRVGDVENTTISRILIP